MMYVNWIKSPSTFQLLDVAELEVALATNLSIYQ